MKRLQYSRYGGPEVMSIEEWPLPALAPGKVRIRVEAAAVNPLDWKLRQGAMKLITGRRFPRGMGSDFAGVVEKLGSGVTGLRVGDKVFGTVDIKSQGAFAEFVDADARLVVGKPPVLSFNEAACIPIPATTAWAAIVGAAKARPGLRIFIHGCSGAVGSFAMQLAVARGATVAGSCGAVSLANGKPAGVEAIYDYRDSALFATAGRYDVVFDTLGTLPIAEGLALLRPKGRMIDINPTPGRVLRGFISGHYKLVFSTMGYKSLPDIAKAAAERIFRPSIGLEVPFIKAASVLQDVESGRRPPGRVVFHM